jgi:hypothetical protein
MENTIVQYKMQQPQTADEIKEQVQSIQRVMRSVMQKDTHYGVIQGAGNKPVLFKPGAEMLLATFRIAVKPMVEDLSHGGEIRYRCHAQGVHMATDTIVGEGIGECSSGEEKYKWRAAVCPEEYDNTDPTRRRIKYRRHYRSGDIEQIRQVRQESADQANTILKMAKKRAEVDLCLTALACSDIFTQDLEDDDAPAAQAPRAQRSAPRSSGPPAANGDNPITDKQVSLLNVKIDQSGIGLTDFLNHFSVGTVSELPFSRMNEALEWIKESGA